MIVLDKTEQNLSAKKRHEEIRISARAVSRGISIGKAVCLHGRKRQFYRVNLENEQIEPEIRRFRAAVRLAKRQIKKISLLKFENTAEARASIFDAHQLILEDKSLILKIETFIAENKVNAEWAVKAVTDLYISKYKTINDEYIRERYIDVEDIAERILSALAGGGKQNIQLEKNSVIVAKEISPSTLVELTDSDPQAIVTERGGWTSHAFILAREINLPAVTGVKNVLRRVHTGDEIIVDGFSGQIIFHPSEATLEKYKLAVAEFERETPSNASDAEQKFKTLDGREITIRANADFVKGFVKAKSLGARGIGLYRSEFLFNQKRAFPTEQEQISAYQKIARLTGADGIRIRTFDLSLEQSANETAEREQNPALGLRGIRLGLTERKQFRTQLRAILQASADNRIDIVLPMISDVSEVLLAKKILNEERKKLEKKKVKIGNPLLGAMVEIPATVFIADELAAEVDFLSLGTNDLVQYLLAVDRDNESVAEWFRTLHPSVIRALKIVIKAAENTNKPLIVCGEMAGSPVYAPILIGMGATDLSMNISSISRIKNTVSSIAFEEAAELAVFLEKCRTAEEAENLVNEYFSKKWSHLFAQLNLPQNEKQKKAFRRKN